MGRQADFRHVTLIMTSNVGARDASRRAIGFSGGRRGGEDQAFERVFSPEFRNRLDAVVQFEPLTPEVMAHVVDKFVKQVEERLSEKGIHLALTDPARRWLAEKGYAPELGARPLDRVIQTELEDRLADEVLFGGLGKGGTVTVDRDEDRLVFRVDSPQ
jgi:ATP-dependent Clp protease ATP-binding subunit ClpA